MLNMKEKPFYLRHKLYNPIKTIVHGCFNLFLAKLKKIPSVILGRHGCLNLPLEMTIQR